MKKYNIENIQIVKTNPPVTDSMVNKNIPSGSGLKIQLTSFRKQMDNKHISPSSNVPQMYSLLSVPGQKIKILHAKGIIPTTSVPSMLTQPANIGGNICFASSINKDSGAQSKPLTSLTVASPYLRPKASILPVVISSSKYEDKFEEDCDNQLVSPSSRWLSQPRSYRGAKRDNVQRKVVRKVALPSFVDTTDGETSGMGSSVDEPIESSTESASETSSSFLQPKLSLRPLATSPLALKKRRGGWPKGRKRKPELPGTKPPKAPLTAYVLFLNERRKYYKDTHAHLPFVEVTKLLGAEWSAMTPEQKAVYMTRSEQDKRRYRTELQTYRQSHDYQILLRKKRIKNAMSRGQTTEESSDFTDEVDDDESEELYCRICEQWFSSLHNKREHLYGKPHLQAITGEYQREREAEEKRQSATITSTLLSDTGQGGPEKRLEEETATESAKETETDEPVEPVSIKVDSLSSRRDSIGVTSTTEEEPDEEEEEEDEEEDGEYDGEEEVTEEEGNAVYWNSASDSERVTDAAEGVISKVFSREKEIRFLRGRYEKSRMHNQKVLASLLHLQARHKLLKEEQERLLQEEKTLLQKAENLVRMSEFCGFETFKGLSYDEGENIRQPSGKALDCDALNTGMSFELGKLGNDPVTFRSADTIIDIDKVFDCDSISGNASNLEINNLLGCDGLPEPSSIVDVDKLLACDSTVTEHSPTDLGKLINSSVTNNGPSGTRYKLPDRIKVQKSSGCLNEVTKCSSGPSDFPLTCENVPGTHSSDILPSHIILNDSRTNFSSSNIIAADVPIDNCKISTHLFLPQQLPNEYGSIVLDSRESPRKIEEKFVRVGKQDSFKESCTKNELGSCSFLSGIPESYLAFSKNREQKQAGSAVKIKEMSNVIKFKRDFDHSYSKVRYSPILSRKKFPNVELRKDIKEREDLDPSNAINSSNIISCPTQGYKVHKTLPSLGQIQRNVKSTYEGELSVTTNRKHSDMNDTVASCDSRTYIPASSTPSEDDKFTLIKEKSSFEVSEDTQHNLSETKSLLSYSNLNANIDTLNGSEDDENSSHSFIFLDNENLSKTPELLIESPELNYSVDDLLQDDVSCLGVDELCNIQWEEDLSIIEEPALGNIFEEDYMTNLLYESCS